MNILVDSQIPLAERFFSKLGRVTSLPGREITAAALTDIDVLLVRSVTQVNERLLANSAVQFIGTATSGVDHIDQDYCQQRGISVAYAPGSNARSVAEYVLSVLLALHENDLNTLNTKTVGIVGCGHVGTCVTEFLQALGLQCKLCDPPLAATHSEQNFVELDEILNCDIVSLHVPLTDIGEHATRNMISTQQLNAMSADSILINTARGGVVDETALLQALNHQQIQAVIDTWQAEPNINSDLMQRASIATPHIAGYSQDGKHRATSMLYQCVCHYFDRQANQHLDTVSSHEQYTIAIDHQVQVWDIVKTLVHAAYDVRVDHQMLLKSLAMSATDRAQFFDQCRREYSSRYEFNHYHYAAKDISESVNLMLKSLGFQSEELP